MISVFDRVENIMGKGEMLVNPLPNEKILDLTKLKTFAYDKLHIAKMTISLFDREENTMAKGHQHFSHCVFQSFLC